jgi:hypothetical protein
MQPLLDGPRSSLTEAQVKGLLQSHSAIQIGYGADGLDASFQQVADIGAYVSGGDISSDITSTVQRVIALNIDSDVTASGWSYLSGFVKPYMTFTDLASGVAARFNLGVYTLTTPTRPITAGAGPQTLQFQGYDLMYLLRQEVGDSYEVAAGTDPADAAAAVIGLAIPEVEVLTVGSTTTLPTRLSWPFDPANPITFLDIVNVLLTSIGYREVWVDWEGRFRIEPFIDMQQTDFEWTFDTNADDNIVAQDATQDIDVYDVPNWWRFVMQNLTGPAVEGVTQFTWTDSSPANPGSTANRGRVIRHIESVAAASYSDLTTYGQRVIARSMSPGETFTVKTQPFPLAWHMDTIHFLSPALDVSLPSTPGGTRRVVSVTWKLDLTGQTDMEWSWQTITDQTAGLGLLTTTVSA